MPCLRLRESLLLSVAAGLLPLAAAAQDKPVYRCPGNLYTDQLTPREAADKGCRTLDGAPVTVVQSRRPTPPAASGGGTAPAPAARGPEQRVDPGEQKARDTDARRILEAELKREEEALAALRREFNDGNPERRGDERNFERYQERVKQMREAISRKEADLAAIRRELSKLPPG
jgi:hypothetical protein